MLENKRKSRQNDDFAKCGWGGWIRTNECRHQKPMPYHLATPQTSNTEECMLIFFNLQAFFLFFITFFTMERLRKNKITKIK